MTTTKRESDARGAMDALVEMSSILNTGLNRETISVCLRLCENGVNPEALAAVIKELRVEAAALKAAEETNAEAS